MILRVYKSCNGNNLASTTCVSGWLYLSQKRMYRTPLALLLLLFVGAVAHGQSLARLELSTPNFASKSESAKQQDAALRAIASLKRLHANTIVYRSLGDFEENGKLARVSFDTFKSDLDEVSAEVEVILVSMSDPQLKNQIRNALASYQDGAYWWQKVYQPRVINVSSLTGETNRTSADAFLMTNAPYTVAIHWRQASTYLQRAERQVATLSR